VPGPGFLAFREEGGCKMPLYWAWPRRQCCTLHSFYTLLVLHDQHLWGTFCINPILGLGRLFRWENSFDPLISHFSPTVFSETGVQKTPGWGTSWITLLMKLQLFLNFFIGEIDATIVSIISFLFFLVQGAISIGISQKDYWNVGQAQIRFISW